MKIIICGAGEVGKTLAERLSKEKNDITIILKSINRHIRIIKVISKKVEFRLIFFLIDTFFS